MPESQGDGNTASPKCFGTPYVCQNSLTLSDKIWYDNTWEVASTTPRPKGVGPRHFSNFLDLLHACTQYEKQQSSHGDQTRWEENFYTVYNECWRGICLR